MAAPSPAQRAMTPTTSTVHSTHCVCIQLAAHRYDDEGLGSFGGGEGGGDDGGDEDGSGLVEGSGYNQEEGEGGGGRGECLLCLTFSIWQCLDWQWAGWLSPVLL